jgi:molecular chaperone GrpE (heat shock protein)
MRTVVSEKSARVFADYLKVFDLLAKACEQAQKNKDQETFDRLVDEMDLAYDKLRRYCARARNASEGIGSISYAK